MEILIYLWILLDYYLMKAYCLPNIVKPFKYATSSFITKLLKGRYYFS